MGSVWMYAPDSGHGSRQPMVGFTAEVADWVIGHVDRHQDQPGMQHLVVGTGMWKFGRAVLIPAGAVTAIDAAAQKV